MTSTGFEALDRVLHGLRDDDIVVWQLNSLSDFKSFAQPFVTDALRHGRGIIYFRFTDQVSLLDNTSKITVCKLDAGAGFASLVCQIRACLKTQVPGAIYLFDCLSGLQYPCMTDLMTANLLSVISRDISNLKSTAYVPLLRNLHSYSVLGHIQQTASVVFDLYRCETDLFLHPVKVSGRYSPTMFLPHRVLDGHFLPISTQHPSSAPAAGQAPQNRIQKLALLLSKESPGSKSYTDCLETLCRIAFGNETRMFNLARTTLGPDDFMHVGRRMAGDGAIGGRAAGLLLANRILSQDEAIDCDQYLESTVSYYVGSDIFCTYLVDNDLWDLYADQMTSDGYFTIASELKERLLKGRFSDVIRQQFHDMLEQFEQIPIIVRSSSLMEDSFQGAFAGKYESIFLANQGDLEHCLSQFEAAVRRVYSSVMNADALVYRRQRGLDQQQEQMALVVQKISGSRRKGYFCPDAAGVGTSQNGFAWAPHLDPQAGMLRLVMGLGTRAVDRTDNDYPRIVALDDPQLKTHGSADDMVRFSQHEMDVLNIDSNCLETFSVQEFIRQKLGAYFDMFAVREPQTENIMKQLDLQDRQAWIVTFDKLLNETMFPQTMRKILKTLERKYNYPVDVEFTLNLTKEAEPKICLVQCRPMHTIGTGQPIQIPADIETQNIFFKSRGHMMGGSISRKIDKILYVWPAMFCNASTNRRYEIARLIGHLNRKLSRRDVSIMMMGPGRWGTTTPSLGVPVSFAEINNTDVLVEIAYEGGNLMPELSFGTHFFHDLVENSIFYAALFPQKNGVVFNEKLLREIPNQLPEVVSGYDEYVNYVGLYDVAPMELQLIGDIVSQDVLCFTRGN
jgi:hypothetical protein